MTPLAAIVTPAPGARGGGVERHAGLLADLLRDRGWEVREVGGTAQVSRWGRRFGLEASTISSAAVAPLQNIDPDLVITNGFLGGGVRNTPRIHVYHGTMVSHVLRGEGDLSRRERASRVLAFGLAEWRAGGHGAVTVAVSEEVGREVARYYRRDVDAVIETCADLDHFKPLSRKRARKRFGLDQKEKLALFVGRFEYRKGADMLEEICGRAGCRLMVAGEGAPESAVRLGQLGHDELPWAYAAADCVLFPTRYEGCSFVVMEALAAGRPLVSTATGWAPTLVREIRGYAPFIVTPEVEPLAIALRRALEHPDAVPVTQAAELVRANLGLARFRERWSDLIDDVVS